MEKETPLPLSPKIKTTSRLEKNSPVYDMGLFFVSSHTHMTNILKKIRRHRFFLLFVLLFAYAQSVQIRIWTRGELNGYIFTPEAAVASLITACILFFILDYFIRHWQKTKQFGAGDALKIFGTSLLVYWATMQIAGFTLSLLFNTVERNFNRQTFMLSTFSDLMDGFIYGSFFLAYRYYNASKKHQEQLIVYNQALSESKINQLKNQLNPHFLFNNLNILDQLIEEDKSKASDFLNEFAEIYRYVLQASDKKLVPLHEELSFAEHYFNFIQHKYGNAYQLTIESQNTNGLIVPLTLQLLIENAVQHNLGTETNPVYIKIREDKNLFISNNLISKRNIKPTSGRALKNLKEQYKLLANHPVEIQKSDKVFSVIIPIIQAQ